MAQMQNEATTNGLTPEIFEDILGIRLDAKGETLKTELQLAFSSPDSDYISCTADDIINRNKNSSLK